VIIQHLQFSTDKKTPVIQWYCCCYLPNGFHPWEQFGSVLLHEWCSTL